MFSKFIKLLGCVAVIAAGLAVNTSNADSSSVKNSVWVTHTKGIVRLDANTLEKLQDIAIPETPISISLDLENDRIWALAPPYLYGLSSSGEIIFSTNPPGLKSKNKFDNKKIDNKKDIKKHYGLGGGDNLLALNGSEGDVWLVTRKHIHQYSHSGQLLQTITKKPKIDGIVYNSHSKEFWVMDSKRLYRFDSNNGSLELITKLQHTIRDISPEFETNNFWVVTKKNLVKLSAEGAILEEIPFDRPKHIASSSENKLWIATEDKLYLYQPEDSLRFEMYPFETFDSLTIEDIVAVGENIWLNTQEALLRVDTDSQTQAVFRDSKSIFGLSSMAVSVSSKPLEVEINNPKNGAYIADIQPVFEFEYNDGTSVDRESIRIEINGNEKTSTCTHEDLSSQCILESSLTEGLNLLVVIVQDKYGNTTSSSIEFTIDVTPPSFLSLNPKNPTYVNTAEITVSGGVSESSKLTVNSIATETDLNNFFSIDLTGLVEGENNIELIAEDRAGNVETENILVILDTNAPSPIDISLISFRSFSIDQIEILGSIGTAESKSKITIRNLRTGAISTVTAKADGSFSAIIAAQPGDELEIINIDLADNKSKPVSTVITTAPLLNNTITSNLYETNRFILDQYQLGESPNVIEPKRASVVRGLVMNREGEPLSGVTVKVLDRPELGYTTSRIDGQIDLLINGGGAVTIEYEKTGYLRARRTINVPWQKYTWLPDVVLIQQSSKSTLVSFDVGESQFITGEVTEDVDGKRQAAIYFPPNTTAELIFTDNSQESVTSGLVSVTEYTVGTSGPYAMPATLPPSSAYTYAAELTLNEAVSRGAKRVDFNQSVIVYVDNFINFPTGESVPSGFFDWESNSWKASKDGQVVKVLNVAGGIATLDVDGNGETATPQRLSDLGITNAELVKIAENYEAGKTLWRVPVDHFTPWDFNWPYGPPEDAETPPEDRPDGGDQDESKDEDEDCNSILLCQSQILGETLNIVGTPFSLNYRSDRVIGRRVASNIDIPLSGASVPQSLKRIDLEITVAGQRFQKSFPPNPNQNFTYIWNQKDGFGRALVGNQEAEIKVSYVYGLIYYSSYSDFRQSFGLIPSSSRSSALFSAARQTSEIKSERSWNITVGAPWDSRVNGIGGWTVNVHHAYDSRSKSLFQGDGLTRHASDVDKVISKVAGKPGVSGYSGDGGQGHDSTVRQPRGLAVGKDGTLYFADTVNHRIRKITPDGIINTIAGNGFSGYSGDGGPATSTRLRSPSDVAIGPDGALFIVDSGNHRIRSVNKSGVISTIAGTGTAGVSGDGGLATEARLHTPRSIAVNTDGSFFVSDQGNNRIRYIGTNGLITTYAGNGSNGDAGDNGLATLAELSSPTGINLDKFGNLYIADSGNSKIRRVGPDGIITSFAGDGTYDVDGDGGLAVNAKLKRPEDVVITEEGYVLIVDADSKRIRVVEPGGSINTIAGDENNTALFGLAGDITFEEPTAITAGPEGSVFISDRRNNVILKLASSFPSYDGSNIIIASEDGKQVYIFDRNGKHIETVNYLTGKTLFKFEYGPNGFLSLIRDVDGNETTINRNASGDITEIVAPFGSRTQVTLNNNKYLNTFTNPANESYKMYYHAGLLTRFELPGGKSATMDYDSLGRLTRDANPEGGEISFSYETMPSGYGVTKTSPLKRTTKYTVEPSYNFGKYSENRTTVHPDNTQVTSDIQQSFSRINYPDGSTSIETTKADPIFNAQSPMQNSRLILKSVYYREYENRDVKLSDPDNVLSLERFDSTRFVNGREYKSQYERTSNKFTITTPEGRTINQIIDSAERPIQRQFGSLAITNYTYNSAGEMTKAIVGEGTEAREYQMTYDSNNRLESIKDPLGRISGFSYDAANRPVTINRPDGTSLQISYDANGNIESLTTPNSQSHQVTHNALGLETAYGAPDIGSGIEYTTKQYNLDKQLISIIRPDDKNIAYEYDNAGRLSAVQSPHDRISLSYANNGTIESVSTDQGVSLNLEYDSFLPTLQTWSGQVNGNVVTSYDANLWVNDISVNGQSVSFSHDNDGLVTKAGDLLLNQDPELGLLRTANLGKLSSEFTYNQFGERVGVKHYGTSHLNLTLDKSRASSDFLAIQGTVKNAAQVLVNGVDMNVSLIGEISGQVEIADLNTNNSILVEVFDEAGEKVAQSTTTIFKEVASTNMSVDKIIHVASNGDVYFRAQNETWVLPFGNDTASQPAWLTDASHVSSSSIGDIFVLKNSMLMRKVGDQLVLVADLSVYQFNSFEIGIDNKAYLPVNNRIYTVDELGNIDLHTEIADNVSLSHIDSSSWGVVVMENFTGRIFKINTDGSYAEIAGTSGFRRTLSDLAVDSTGRICYGEQLFLSALGEIIGAPVAECRLPSGEIVPLNLDAGFRNSLEFGNSDEIYYESAENLYKIDSSETALLAGVITQATLSLDGDAGNAFFEVGYTRDKAGRIISKLENVLGETSQEDYFYDSMGRLERVTQGGVAVSSYTYDVHGNRTEASTPSNLVSATYNSQDQLITYGETTYAYSTGGDLESKTESGLITFYNYDALGNLRNVTLPGDMSIEYIIDGRNRRVGKKVNDVMVQGFLYKDQLNPVAELDGTGNVISRFIYGEKYTVPSYMIKDSQTYRIISDHIGSPRLVVNTATGEVMQRMDYDIFGRVINDTNPGFQPFGFAGGIYDQHTEFVRFGARDYDPTTGRWTSRDPVLLYGGSNLYQYTAGDPINYVDPRGEGLVVGAVIGAASSFAATIISNGTLGQAAMNAVVGGALGFFTGGLSGLNALNNIKGAAAIGASSGALGNIAGQFISIKGDPCKSFRKDFNYGSLLGSTLTGAFTGGKDKFTAGTDGLGKAGQIATAGQNTAITTAGGLVGGALSGGGF